MTDIYKPFEANTVVALMGTCADSPWRNDFMTLNNEKVYVYNPDKGNNWNSEVDPLLEAYAMKNADIVVFAITSESDSVISLGELPVAMVQVLTDGLERQLVFFIEPLTNEFMKTIKDESMRNLYTKSKGMRDVLLSHFANMGLNSSDNIRQCFSIDEMFDVVEKMIL